MRIRFNWLSYWLIYTGATIGAFSVFHLSIMLVSMLMIGSGILALFTQESQNARH